MYFPKFNFAGLLFASIFIFTCLNNAQGQTSDSEINQLIARGDSLYLQGEYKAAENAYKKALKIDRKSIKALKGLGYLARDQQKWKKAKKWFKKVIQVNPDDKEALDFLIKTTNPKILTLIKKAEQLLNQQEYKKARKLYEKILKKYKDTFEAYRGLARIGFLTQDWGLTKDYSKKIIEILPDDIESNYYLAIAYRETGKTKNKLIKKKQFGWSEKYFNKVIKIDSTYEHVLYERALLDRWRKKWLSAILWARRQFKLKPNSATSQVGLYKLYKLYLFYGNKKELRDHFQQYPDDWTRFFQAELNREQKHFEKARNQFQALLEKNIRFSKIPVYLSLVRLSLQTSDETLANRYFVQALNNLNSDADAAFMFEESKYIFNDQEFERYEQLTTVQEKRQFFRQFWSSRNPLPATDVQLRAIEHFQRLLHAEANYWYYGVRSWFNSPNKIGYKNLKMPRVYYLNDAFNDKGLIYIRHGEPDDRAIASGQLLETYESWRYVKRDTRPELIFHFVMETNAVENNWRLISFPIQPNQLNQLVFQETNTIRNNVVNAFPLLDQLAGWNPKIDRFIFAAQQGTSGRMEFVNVIQGIIDEGAAQIQLGLNSDRYTWKDNIKLFDFPFSVTQFRGKSGKTLVDISYALPLKKLHSAFKHGVAVFDSLWNPMGKLNFTESWPVQNSVRQVKNNLIHRVTLPLSPNTYYLSLFAQSQDNHKLGGWNVVLDVDNFAGDSLLMSDLQLAYLIEPHGSDSTFIKNGMTIIPNPTGVFNINETVYLYYEVYNLKTDDKNESNFEIETILKQTKQKGKVSQKNSRSGKKQKSISIKAERRTGGTQSVEFASLDISNMEPGNYELTVQIHDQNSGEEIKKSIEIKLKNE
ncbi:MAG: tetratricopeptide repeat protein [Calditrichaeota bacterium]|nr:MAG: tetratricopeptide repeat protein [Calditrichota bacterium]